MDVLTFYSSNAGGGEFLGSIEMVTEEDFDKKPMTLT